VDRISGACFAIKSDFISSYGLFDPIYFMYYEDDDLSRRIGYLKYDIVLVPTAQIAHDNHMRVSSDQLRELDLWGYHSRSIFKLKDIRYSLLRAFVNIFYLNVASYALHLISFAFVKVFQTLIMDLRLLVKLPKIVKRRSQEKKLRAQAGSNVQ
jgi:GT2 family glycosyltransferase